MITSLAQFQDHFAQALATSEPDAVPEIAALARQPGFSVYRNTVLKGCIDALQANYPSVARLVGEEWFRAAAATYVRLQPPQDARMLYYGAGFAEFLARFEPAADLSYLPDVARLDRLWTEAHAACDELPLDPAALSGLDPDALAGTVLHPHASAHWSWFAEQPIYTIWRRNREALDDGSEIAWQGEGVLLTRPRGAVAWIALDAGGCAFLDACMASNPLADAATAALNARPDTDLAQLLSTLLEAGAFGRIGGTCKQS
ncbi:HvfC/BufC N-terminal domain-containing protein [Massilia cavernae]|uniref:DUF2063 domain-containing protein n=1 Tax=Massilia cavernae TaxID=2320864 RepID=A0A418XQ57_9BURK|nr:DNA-binding domain-containing protein [Massilia cavernae]RJG14643.1 DUF2063 domain-containing protein [Massilia cavernae]